MNAITRMVAITSAATTLAGCGAVSTGARPSGSQTSNTFGQVATPVSPVAAAPGSPPPTSAPPPPPPALLVYQDPQGTVHAVDAQAHQHFQIPRSAAVGVHAHFYVGGGHLLAAADGKVLVFDREGSVIGGGLGEKSAGGDGAGEVQLFPNPDGTRWAWLHDTTNLSSSNPYAPPPTSTGSIRVAGIGEAPHTVSRFSLPPDAGGLQHTELIYQWSDRGIVVATIPEVCGDLREDSTVLLDPDSGRSTPLYGNDRHLVDVHAGVTVGYTIAYADKTSTNTVLVGGSTQFSAVTVATNSLHIGGAYISPDGAHVAVGYTGLAGCGGQWIGATELITVATRQKSRISTLESIGWLDDQTVIAQAIVDQPCRRGADGECAHQPNHLDLLDLQGNWRRIVDDGAYLGTIH